MKLVWAKGGTGEVIAVKGEAVSLLSSVPSPPGSRIDGTLASGDPFRVKITSSKKREDGSFALEGRAIDMTRETRERILAARAEAAT